jgi:tetratricopeptide (TPR) repeat protein
MFKQINQRNPRQIDSARQLRHAILFCLLCIITNQFSELLLKPAVAAEKNIRPQLPPLTGAKDVLEYGIDYDQIIKEHPQDYIAWYRRGMAKQRDLNNTGALKDYTQSLKLNPLQSDHPTAKTSADARTIRAWAYEYSGTILFQQHKYEAAIEDFTHAIKLRPNHVPAYQNRALAYRKVGKDKLAYEDLANAAYQRNNPTPDPCAKANLRLLGLKDKGKSIAPETSK